jgi:hypothetical protein
LLFSSVPQANWRILSEPLCYFDRWFPEGVENLKFLLANASDRVSGAFYVFWAITIDDWCHCFFIKEPDF